MGSPPFRSLSDIFMAIFDRRYLATGKLPAASRSGDVQTEKVRGHSGTDGDSDVFAVMSSDFTLASPGLTRAFTLTAV
jgi:hypothetical protein